ncbi:TPA: VanZ family protein [Clostridium perfringens]
MKKMKKFNSFMLFGVFLLLYAFLCSYTLIFKYVSPLELFSSNREYIRSTNVIPFHTIYSYLSGTLNVSKIIVASNIFGNIILFVPLGIYLQLLKKNKIWINTMIVFFIALFVEMFQFIFGFGAADIDDVILNCLGGLIGILIYRGLCKFLKSEEKVRTVIVLLGLIVILIPILVTTIFGFRFRLG